MKASHFSIIGLLLIAATVSGCRLDCPATRSIRDSRSLQQENAALKSDLRHVENELARFRMAGAHGDTSTGHVIWEEGRDTTGGVDSNSGLPSRITSPSGANGMNLGTGEVIIETTLGEEMTGSGSSEVLPRETLQLQMPLNPPGDPNWSPATEGSGGGLDSAPYRGSTGQESAFPPSSNIQRPRWSPTR